MSAAGEGLVDLVNILIGRQDRLETRIEEAEDKLDGIPELRRSMDRLVTAVYTAATLIVVAAVGVILFASPPA